MLVSQILYDANMSIHFLSVPVLLRWFSRQLLSSLRFKHLTNITLSMHKHRACNCFLPQLLPLAHHQPIPRVFSRLLSHGSQLQCLYKTQSIGWRTGPRSSNSKVHSKLAKPLELYSYEFYFFWAKDFDYPFNLYSEIVINEVHYFS